VTLVQRTPSYIAAKPLISPLAQFLNNWLPQSLAVRLNRFIVVVLGALFYQYCIRFPDHARKLIKGGMYKEVKGVMSKDEFEKHFTPPYNPWQQRFCLSPAGDFFQPLRDGKATMATGHIEKFTKEGILMKDGQLVEADFIVSATGLTMQQNFPFSTIKTTIDGKVYKASENLIYNGIMIGDVPNFACIIGYTNASWTLKADIVSVYFTKLLNYMRSNSMAKVVPREGKDKVTREFFSGGLTSGYFGRAGDVLPKQGDGYPWRGGVNYIMDFISLTVGGLKLDNLEFTLADKKRA